MPSFYPLPVAVSAGFVAIHVVFDGSSRIMNETRTITGVHRFVVMEMKETLIAMVALVVLSSCTTQEKQQTELGNDVVTARMVLESSPLGSGPDSANDLDVDILALSPEMMDFLDRNVKVVGNRDEQLRRLARSVMNPGEFQLDYDDSTRTAQDTFEIRRGNCFSFTSMFVAMSRYLGLEASYQEVEIPPNWSMSGQSYIFSQHINAYVDLLNGRTRVVDFNSYDYVIEHGSRKISDERAFAHFFNNLGAEQMLSADSAGAYPNFRQSLLLDDRFSPAWINMGILHRREGYPDYAEASYLEALEVDPDNLMALSNLANLYMQQEEPELAEEYAARVRSHRMRNPYYRYHKAGEAFAEGDYETAIEDLKYAIQKRKEEDQFYYLLSLSYLMSGDREEAQKWMKRAEDAARQKEDQQKYHHKLDLLRGLDED